MDNPTKTENAEANYLDELVGEGKRYKTAAELAKAKIHADAFIENLKTQTEELRAELDKRMALEEMFLKTKNDDLKPVDPPIADKTTADPPKQVQADQSKVDESELIEKVKAELRRDAEQTSRAANFETVKTRLLEEMGDPDKVNKFMDEQSQKLGFSVSELADIAAKSPTAFYNLLGLQNRTKASPDLSSTVKTEAFQLSTSQPKPGTKAYYDKMRKESPRKYLSAAVQLEIHKAYMKDPAAFNNG
jgi:hypothetical protein